MRLSPANASPPIYPFIDLQHPEHIFWYISQETSHCEEALTNLPERHFFGREITRGEHGQAVALLDLRKRRYLGPTTMDAEVSLLMANCALARKGSMVFDPFFGTGSMAVAAAYWGSAVLGSDIDMRVLKGIGARLPIPPSDPSSRQSPQRR